MLDKLEINSIYTDQLTALMEQNNFQELVKIPEELHIADIAKIIEDLSSENTKYLYGRTSNSLK